MYKSIFQFLLRRQVLALYREALRIVREEGSPDNQKQLKDWIRYEFDSKRGLTDPVIIPFILFNLFSFNSFDQQCSDEYLFYHLLFYYF